MPTATAAPRELARTVSIKALDAAAILGCGAFADDVRAVVELSADVQSLTIV